MPKIDIDKMPLDTATRYPRPFDKAVIGRARKRLGNAAGLDAVRRQHLHAQARRRVVAAALA